MVARMPTEPSERDALLRPRGHRELAFRSAIAALQAFVSVLLFAHDIDAVHMRPIAACQVVSCLTLALQYAVRASWDVACFRARGAASAVRCAALFHAATCGHARPFCDARPFHFRDSRLPLRAIVALGAVRMLANAASLLAQAADPGKRSSRDRGHEQLRIRSTIRWTGVPLNLASALLKVALLAGTRYARSPLEVAANVARGAVFVPLSAASLRRQWRDGGPSPPPPAPGEGL